MFDQHACSNNSTYTATGGTTEAAGQTGGCYSIQQAETGHCHCPKTYM